MPTCGHVSRQSLRHGGLDREYLYLLPRSACGGGRADGKAHQTLSALRLPLLVLVHCFGCSARDELGKFAAAAEAASFALLAPEGMWSSWNTPSCCGEAKANKLDDFGFLDAVVTDAAASLPVARGALFGSGFSNGGFVTSLLPSRSTHTWRGLAPVAGHEYEFDARAPVPVSMHHCEADRAVQFGGCCDGEPHCCCGIGAGRSSCVGAVALHARWLRLNRCKGARRAFGVGGAVCHVGHGCAANTSLCAFPRDGGCYHAQWARQFAGTESIVQFFAAEARRP